MSGYLLDTDWVIDFLNNQSAAVQSLSRLTANGVAVSIISYGDLFEGAYYGRDAESALRLLHEFMAGVQLAPLAATVVERFAILRGSLPRNHRQQLGGLDLLIAATALTYQLTLVTRNLRDFRLVPGLALYQDETL